MPKLRINLYFCMHHCCLRPLRVHGRLPVPAQAACSPSSGCQLGSHVYRLPGVHWQSTVIMTLCAACWGHGKQPALSSPHHMMCSV